MRWLLHVAVCSPPALAVVTKILELERTRLWPRRPSPTHSASSALDEFEAVQNNYFSRYPDTILIGPLHMKALHEEDLFLERYE